MVRIIKGKISNLQNRELRGTRNKQLLALRHPADKVKRECGQLLSSYYQKKENPPAIPGHQKWSIGPATEEIKSHTLLNFLN